MFRESVDRLATNCVIGRDFSLPPTTGELAMRKQVDRLVVAVSLCLLAASRLFVPGQTAQAQAPPGGYGATCLTIIDDQWCKRTGTTACDLAWAQQGYCAGPCESCNDDTIISNS